MLKSDKNEHNIYNIIKNSNVTQLEIYIKKNGLSIKHWSFLEINDINIIKNLIKINSSVKKIESIIRDIKVKRNNIIEIIKRNNLNELQNFIQNKRINDLKELNTKDFDILICAIDANVSIDIINYIIIQFHYDTFNYYIDNKNVVHDYRRPPLFYALSNNNFEIANLLLEKGANINYDNGCILHQLYLNKLINDNNLIYILHNGIKRKPLIYFIIELMHLPVNNLGIELEDDDQLQSTNILFYPKDEILQFLKIIFKYYIFDNFFILNLLNAYKNKKIISIQQMNEILETKKNKIIIKDFLYKKAVYYNANSFIDIFLENELRDKSIILSKLKSYEKLGKYNVEI
ncbi:hypothetical protein BCR32DRAFT_245479 [Anaeromyces robustus]|uniref:Uncharacterized protein n=1 Tax=Anaeromyces robustus TaxID=1754192 RepID=A0A1Y1X4U4_9FUNG|nr:hypothetical protein BCR32DRAFT_245479 [Anaeromyces robustus]|eukprot:ORX80665.1 hypothetical protein BCR32DRAFT_245479 [Anaeromyces robustus]